MTNQTFRYAKKTLAQKQVKKDRKEKIMAEENRNTTTANTVDTAVNTDSMEAEKITADSTANDSGNNKAPTVEELMAQLTQERAARAKEKAALDKALSEKANLTKQLRSKQTQQEIEDDAKREEAERIQAHIAELEAYKQRNEAKERYLLQGMNAELANKAAEAEVKRDMDALADIQKQHTNALLKEKEKEWKASRPQINAGDGSGSGMTMEEIQAIQDTEARVKAIAQNIDIYTKK